MGSKSNDLRITKENYIKTEMMYNLMEQEMVTISKKEYRELKKKAALADDPVLQVIRSLDDIKHGRIVKFDPESLDD